MPTELDVVVRWGELDAFGHVNNTVFFRWFEDVRIATFQAMGVPTELGAVGPILASTACDFLAPVTFPSTVRVRCGIASLGRTSFVMQYDAYVAGVQVARGSGVVVLVDYRSAEKVPLSSELRGRLEQLGPLPA